MAVIELVPTVSGDDGYVYDTTFDNSGNKLMYGNLGVSVGSFIRFPNVTIPAGSTINNVEIYRNTYYSLTGTNCNVTLYFNNVDNAVAPTTASGFDALSLTFGLGIDNLPIEGSGTSGYLYQDLGDGYLASELQTVIDRAGWTSGNAIMLVIKDASSTSGSYRSYYSKDGDTSNPLKLIIDYTAEIITPVIGNKYSLPAFKR